MRDKDGKESVVTRWVDDQGQQQVVSFHSSSVKQSGYIISFHSRK